MNFHRAEQRPASCRLGACAHYTERNGRARRVHENETIRRWKIPPKTCSQNCFVNIDSGRWGIVLFTCLKHIRRHLPPTPRKKKYPQGITELRTKTYDTSCWTQAHSNESQWNDDKRLTGNVSEPSFFASSTMLLFCQWNFQSQGSERVT